MFIRTRADRYARTAHPAWLDSFCCDAAAWYESPAEVRAALAWGEQKKQLIAWLRMHMEERLSTRERECVELYYFRGFTYDSIGKLTHTHRSSVCRAIHRAIDKLRAIRDEDQSWRRIVDAPEYAETGAVRPVVSLHGHCPPRTRAVNSRRKEPRR